MRGVGDEVENKEEQNDNEETWIRSGINMLFLDQGVEGVEVAKTCCFSIKVFDKERKE